MKSNCSNWRGQWGPGRGPPAVEGGGAGGTDVGVVEQVDWSNRRVPSSPYPMPSYPYWFPSQRGFGTRPGGKPRCCWSARS